MTKRVMNAMMDAARNAASSIGTIAASTTVRRGGYIPREFRNRQYFVADYRAHRLSPPPRGQQWVQVGPDYVLIAIATGLIAHMVLSQ
ncbi:MAG: RcnB family protein [Rhodoferax sp.]|nr:RcnB family protein [Rhodoferax sp.]